MYESPQLFGETEMAFKILLVDDKLDNRNDDISQLPNLLRKAANRIGHAQGFQRSNQAEIKGALIVRGNGVTDHASSTFVAQRSLSPLRVNAPAESPGNTERRAP